MPPAPVDSNPPSAPPGGPGRSPRSTTHVTDDDGWVPRPWASAVAGVAAATAGLGAAELVASLRPAWPSPVISIGTQVVDRVPQPVKQFAIDTFGTADKFVLVGGIVVVVALAAAGIGILARTRLTSAILATVALAGVAGVAAVTSPTASILALVPAVVAAMVAVPALVAMTPRTADGRAPSAATSVVLGEREASPVVPDAAGTIPRRRFLALAGGSLAFGAAAVGGGRWVRRGRAIATRAASPALPPTTTAAPNIPATAHPDVPGLAPFVTANDDFYRIDTALTVPRLSADGWTLRIHGMVDREHTFSYDELLAMDSVDVPITLTCVSNEVGGRLVGTARWQGVRLADLLDRAGVADDATQLVGRAHDGWTAGFPTEAAFDRDTLVAWGMNGEPLPDVHGYPLRLVTPGLYGYVSATKWLSEIEATTFDAFDQYWVERGWVDDAPIKVASRIDTPTGLATVERGTVAVAGVAWAQTRGISRVEVQVDDGEFQPADLATEVSLDTWRQWVFGWDTSPLEPGRHQLTVRAADGDGLLQPDARQPPFPSGATGWHTLAVVVADA